jgi:hypothetical protein
MTLDPEPALLLQTCGKVHQVAALEILDPTTTLANKMMMVGAVLGFRTLIPIVALSKLDPADNT